MTKPTRGSTAAARPTALTRVRRLADRGVYEPEVIYEVLDNATYCVVAHVIDGQPVATPTLHWRVGARVYWHGSVASRMLKATTASARVCLTATMIDGWVLARSAFNHTANYRSVMCFGTPEPVTDPAEKARLLEAFTEHLFPGRWAQLRPVTRKELGATTILSMPLDLASAKIRTGGPEDEKEAAWPVWAGVIPLSERAGRPQPERSVRKTYPTPRLRRAKAK